MAPRRFSSLLSEGVQGKVVLLRADLNVPLDADGKLRDATRLQRVLPTITALSDAGARLAILSHFGRPKGQINPSMSLRPVVNALSTLLDRPVSFAEDCIGAPAHQAIAALSDGGIAILENTRFHAGEETNNLEFAAALAEVGDVYVNDAFSAAHRAHASTEAIAHILPSYVGLAMQAELDALQQALETPKRPVIAIIGGAKISTKLDLLGNLTQKVDMLVIGGGMANTFLAAQGVAIGTSLCETAMLETAREVMQMATRHKCEIILPVDAAIAPEFAAGQTPRHVSIEAVPDDQMILDCGPQSIEQICKAIDRAETLIWNGPLGAFEIEPFDTATNMAARHAAERTQQSKLISIAGGGDTVAALNHAGAGDHMSYISTAGGAFLEWLEGKTLPGVAALG
jgi:phosphoglycerate kinase